MTTVVKISPLSAIPSRIEGIVTVEKTKSGNTVTVVYRKPGQVKTDTLVFDADELIAYMPGTPGFVIARSNEPITIFAGDATSSGNIKTEDGVIVINKVDYALITRVEVSEDSREAKVAIRAGKVRVKVKADTEEEAPVKPKRKATTRR